MNLRSVRLMERSEGDATVIDERSVALATMTSPEAADAISSAEVALIPVGVTEQHAPT